MLKENIMGNLAQIRRTLEEPFCFITYESYKMSFRLWNLEDRKISRSRDKSNWRWYIGFKSDSSRLWNKEKTGQCECQVWNISNIRTLLGISKIILRILKFSSRFRTRTGYMIALLIFSLLVKTTVLVKFFHWKRLNPEKLADLFEISTTFIPKRPSFIFSY